MDKVFRHLHMPVGLVIEFIAIFSRMEYALKSTKYAIGDEHHVSPAWDKFANEVDDDFNLIRSALLSEAVNYLLEKPPRKQVQIDGGIQFADQAIDLRQRTAQQLLLMVRTVRNNLFHGGKYLPEGEVEEGRNQRLVEASILVLEACIGLDGDVALSYER